VGLFFSLLILPVNAEYRLQASNELLQVYTNPKLSNLAQQILKPLSDRVFSMQAELGIYSSTPAAIYIVPNRISYQSLAYGKEKIVESSDAFYSMRENRIYVRTPDQINDLYIKVLMHEYIHWYINSVFINAPLWFHEGMATYYSGQMGYDHYLRFIRARWWGHNTDLGLMLNSYPESKQDWAMFYLTSTYAIKYMKDVNERQWKNFWDYSAYQVRQHSQAVFSNVFFYTYNTSFTDFSTAFSRYTKRLSYQYIFIAVNAVVFGSAPVFLILAYLKKRSRHKLLPDAEEEYIYLDEDDEEEADEEDNVDSNSHTDQT
jgi:hypothetical protein